MTIKGFAEKYGVTYNLAYEATFGLRRNECLWNNKDFPEQQVLHNLKKLIKQRIARHEKGLEDAKRLYADVCWRASK